MLWRCDIQGGSGKKGKKIQGGSEKRQKIQGGSGKKEKKIQAREVPKIDRKSRVVVIFPKMDLPNTGDSVFFWNGPFEIA